MTNADGGWLVIGFREHPKGTFTPDPAHSDGICSSYEPTDLAKIVNSTVQRGQSIRLEVHMETHPKNGMRYPVISIYGFDRTPVICRSAQAAAENGDQILRQGAVYLRRPGAETSEVSTLQDWEDLIALAVKKRRDEFLNEFKELLERMSSPRTVPEPATTLFETWTDEMRRRAFGDPLE